MKMDSQFHVPGFPPIFVKLLFERQIGPVLFQDRDDTIDAKHVRMTLPALFFWLRLCRPLIHTGPEDVHRCIQSGSIISKPLHEVKHFANVFSCKLPIPPQPFLKFSVASARDLLQEVEYVESLFYGDTHW